jgi:hypothetical protein
MRYIQHANLPLVLIAASLAEETRCVELTPLLLSKRADFALVLGALAVLALLAEAFPVWKHCDLVLGGGRGRPFSSIQGARREKPSSVKHSYHAVSIQCLHSVVPGSQCRRQSAQSSGHAKPAGT